MTGLEVVQIVVYLILLIALTSSTGSYMAAVYSGEKTVLGKLVAPIERLVYRVCFVNPREEMHWKKYSYSVLSLTLMGLVFTFGLQVFQEALPLNPNGNIAVPWPLALNTAVSFVTNTNWQAYSAESSLGYGVQLFGLTVQNFLSAATGMSILLVVVRALTRERTQNLGNFWVDLTRSILYVLLPLSVVVAILLVSQGVIQNFLGNLISVGLEGGRQILPMGPAASQVAIKQLGTNGGGFFGVNSAHPFENATPFSNFVQMLAILLIPSSQVYMFGVMTKARKHALMLYSVMFILLCVSLSAALWSEYQPNAALSTHEALEGKEVRNGIANSVLWSTATTAASNGSVNAMLDSATPLAGSMAFFQIILGEIIFGGVGSGLYGMLLFVLLTVFLAGLMVGRTPEYFGKKLEAFEMKWALVAIIGPNSIILLGSALSVMLPSVLTSVLNRGPHGLSEILYAFASTSQNNGSAFGGLMVDTVYFNLMFSFAMLVGRYLIIFSILLIAGSMVEKTITPPTLGTFSTDVPIFAVLLFFCIFIIGALTFVPAMALSSIAEHFLMVTGQTF